MAAPLLDHGAGDIARGHDGVIGLARHMQPLELARHLFARARRIGDQDDHAAARARAHQRVAGVREGGDAVVHDAPDVAQHHVVVGRQRGKLRDQRRQCGTHERLRRHAKNQLAASSATRAVSFRRAGPCSDRAGR